MDIKQAWKIAKAAETKFGLKLKKEAWDDGEYYVFGLAKDVDLFPIAVEKKTGDVNVYDPFEHMPAFQMARKVL